MKHKVLLVLLLGIIISVSASAQKVTMNLKQVKLEKVFSAITQQTGLTVAYSRTIVNPDRIVTVEAKNQELSKVLNDLFLGTNINYEIGKTKIYLKEKVTDSEQQTSNANKRNISGRVVVCAKKYRNVFQKCDGARQLFGYNNECRRTLYFG